MINANVIIAAVRNVFNPYLVRAYYAPEKRTLSPHTMQETEDYSEVFNIYIKSMKTCLYLF